MSGQTNARPSFIPSRWSSSSSEKFRLLRAESARRRSGWHDCSRQGHAVHVVTNASSVEPSFRQLLYGRDRETLLGTLDAHGIDVQATTPPTPHSYIPYAPPYVTQLFGLSHLVMARHRCEAIFGWYLEPYGFVAALVGNTTGVPVFIRHAGSDLARLSANCDLHEAYRWALCSATGLIVTNEAEFERSTRNLAAATAAPPDKTS